MEIDNWEVARWDWKGVSRVNVSKEPTISSYPRYKIGAMLEGMGAGG